MIDKIKNDFSLFYKNSKKSFIVIAFFILLAFGCRLFSYSFSIDSEHYIYSSQSTFNWWISLNRWGLAFINKIMNFDSISFWVTNFLTLIIMFLYCICINFLFYLHFIEENKNNFLKYQFIFPIIFLTSPIFAEQYNFINQNFAVSLGILFTTISLILIRYSHLTSKMRFKFVFYAITVFLTTLSFSIYQSLIPLYLLLIVSCYFIYNLFGEKDSNYSYLLKNIIIFILCSLLYAVISKILSNGNSYLSLGWGNDTIFNCIRNIYCVFLTILRCDSIYYNVSYLFALCILFFIFLYLIISKKLDIRLFISLLGLFLSPLYIMIITGVDQLKRTQFNYSFFVGFMFLILILILNFSRHKILKFLRKFCFVLVILSFIIAYRQSYICSNMFYTDEIRFNKDVTFANEIQYEIISLKKYDSSKKYTIVFLGHHFDKPLNFNYTGEVLGSSFFEFDYKEIYGVNQRANIFLKTLGYDYNFSNVEQFEDAKLYAIKNNVPSYPYDGWVSIIEDCILVRLSDEI